MTTNFPTSQDSFSRPSASSALTGHAALHDDLADAIEAIENKVGVDSDTDTSSHDYKIAQLESAPPSHTHGDLYYTETEVDGLLANKQDSSSALTTSTSFGGDVSGTYNAIVVDPAQHSHNATYYTESEIDTKLTEATHNVTGLFKGIRGADSYAVNNTGHATVNFGVTLASTPVAVFVQTTRQDTTGTGGGEYVLSLPVTAISSTSFTFRAYEVNVANSNNDSQVSTIYTTNSGSILVHASWLVIL